MHSGSTRLCVSTYVLTSCPGPTRDAFALNIGVESWQKDSVAKCYAAALEVEPFRLFLCFDMS